MVTTLTDMQKRFSLEFASNGGNATAAAKTAGYSAKSAHEQGRQLLENPRVQEAIMRELMRLRFRSGSIGLEAMISIATNERASAAARVSAARSLMEHAGMIGTAKEILEAREEADSPPPQKVNYLEVLEHIGKVGNNYQCTTVQ